MSATQPDSKKTLPRRLLPWTAVILLAGHMSGAVACLYAQGTFPIKPRDFTIGLVAVNICLALLCRPSFRPALGLLVVLPVIRMADSGVLQRYTNFALGDHSIAVMIMANFTLVMFASLVILSTGDWRKIAIWAAIGVIVLDCGSVLYEGLGYAKYTQIAGRAAGFLTQPNDAIIVLCLALGVLLTLNERFWLNIAMIGIGAVGVGLTLSRSGLLVFVIQTGIWAAMNLRRHFTKIALIFAVAIPAAAVGFALLSDMAASRNFGTDKNAQDRVAAFTGIFSGDTDKMESSERNKDLRDGWEAVLRSPIVGHGTGCASSFWQPHNQWVAIWLDIGFAGPVMLAGVLIFTTARSVLARGKAVLAVVPMWAFTVFSQNLVEMAAYWFCIAVALNELTSSRFRLVFRKPLSQPDMAASH